MADIFVSYSRKNFTSVRELVRYVEKQGWSVFWDRDMGAGSDFEKHLENELAAAKVVLVVWSSNSVESSWVRAEANDGLTRNCLVPVRLDDTVLPLIFRAVETVDLTGWPFDAHTFELRKMVASIKSILEGGGAPENAQDFTNLPLRDDPTLSTRVAQRVLSTLEKNDSGNERIALQLKLESSISDAALNLLAGDRKEAVLETFLNSLAQHCQASWGQLMYQDVKVHSGVVDDRTDKLENIRSIRRSGIQPVDISNIETGYVLRLISENDAELILMLEHYLELEQETFDRLSSALQTLSS